MAVYTRRGDDGTTALYGGKRVLKCDSLVDVYGSVDEVNSWIGILRAAGKSKKDTQLLAAVQNDLFAIGSTLAGWEGDLSPLQDRIREMEQHIDAIEKTVSPLSHFILPAGPMEAAFAHVARSITRRLERQTVAVFTKNKTNTHITKHDQHIILMYLNRLSDLLFMIARSITKQLGVKETAWMKTPIKRKG